MILKYIEGELDLNGKSWEELIHQVYKLRYKDSHYTKIPDNYSGDYGIEGFTRCGIVIQCYYPEKKYDDKTLYEKYRDKVTEDLGKLTDLKNIDGYNRLGITSIKEWHFIVPKIKDKKIIEHCNKKKQEIKKILSQYSHLNKNFDVIVKEADDYKEEIIKCLRIYDYKNFIDLSCEDQPITKEILKKHIDNDISNNISRKIKAINPRNKNIDSLVNIYLEDYVRYLQRKTQLQSELPDSYHNLIRVERKYNRKAIELTQLNPNHSENYKVYSDFKEGLEKIFNDEFPGLAIHNIDELINGVISLWLGDCSLEFRNYN